jgi:hypothetical protein
MNARTLGRYMMASAIVALVASVLGGIAGLVLVRELGQSLGTSLGLTVDALTAVDDSLEVAADTLALVDDGLVNTQDTSQEVVTALSTGADLLTSTADLTSDELAPSITAVEEALPGLVSVASAVDTALSAISRLPIGISYDPDAGLDDSLRAIEINLSGTGAELVEQSTLIRDAGRQLDAVSRGTALIADDLNELDAGIASARTLVADYAVTADQTRILIEDTRGQLATRSTVASVMVVLLALAVALGQLAPLWIGRKLVRNATRVDALLNPPDPPDVPPPG